LEVTDYITVLRDGVHLATKPTTEFDETNLVKLMVGRELSNFYSRTHSYIQNQIILEVKDLTRQKAFSNISFKLFKGEVLGIYGLVGAGRTELAETLFGLSPIERGHILIHNSSIEIKSPKDAIFNSIALVPEDRKKLGLVSMLSVRKNLSLPKLRLISKFEFVNRKEEEKLVRNSVKSLEIRTPDLNSSVEILSGGNQQKVVLGKWLQMAPKVLVLDEPTRGIDVGTKAEVRTIIDNLAEKGMGIILISSELPEILGMSDRILVMREGKIVDEFDREDCSEEIIGASAAGVTISG